MQLVQWEECGCLSRHNNHWKILLRLGLAITLADAVVAGAVLQRVGVAATVLIPTVINNSMTVRGGGHVKVGREQLSNFWLLFWIGLEVFWNTQTTNFELFWNPNNKLLEMKSHEKHYQQTVWNEAPWNTPNVKNNVFLNTQSPMNHTSKFFCLKLSPMPHTNNTVW